MEGIRVKASLMRNFMRLLSILAITGALNVCAAADYVERATRPDAPHFGNDLLGPEFACPNSSAAFCCDNGTTNRCAPTVIVENGSPQILTEAGIYCLGSDLTSPVIINGSSIWLDMNGHTIFATTGNNGITINPGSQDIRIYNGLLDGQLNDANGIVISNGALDVRIEDVTCVDFAPISFGGDGIWVNGAVNTTIARVNCNNCGTGIDHLNDTNTRVIDSTVMASTLSIGTGAVHCTGSVGLLLQGCRANNNADRGIAISACSNVVVSNCVVESNQIHGLVIAVSNTVSVSDVVALSNGQGGAGHGFDIDTVSGITVERCIATGNVSDGFAVIGVADQVIVNQCIANNNTGFGFSNASGTNSQFYSNEACNNGAGNYTGVVAAPIAGPATADGVDNVDCNDTSIVSGCEATPIFNTGATQNLSLPGRYCLAEDITAPAGNVLTITVSSVFVDLNGHTITVPTGVNGISVNAGVTDVRIYNGFINGGGVGLGGIAVAAALDTRIEDVTCNGFTNSAITLSASLRTILNRVSANSSVVGLVCAGDNGTVASNCRFSNNSFTGALFTTASVNGIMQSCKADLNAQGFVVGFGSNAELFNCTAESNTGIGFVVNSANALIDSCVAQYNTSHGFDMQAASVAMVQDSTATNNGGRGFNNAIAANQFYRNSACNNVAPNYNGVTFAPVAGPITADGVDNVDCNDTSIVSGCEATPIFNTGATITLSVAGRYCLAEDVVAAANTTVINITASRIFLDLNGHTVTTTGAGAIGIVVNVGISDVHIYNGIIVGGGTGLAGILVNTASDVQIENVTCKAFGGLGITVAGSTRTTINQVNANTALDGLLISGASTGVLVTNSIFSNNTSNGVNVNGATNVVIRECKADQNGNGFNVQDPSQAELFNCTAQTNSVDGFVATGSVLIDGCVAEYNGSHGFDMLLLSDAMVQNCTATNNGGRGFNNLIASNQFYSNVACDNVLPNYSGVTSAEVAGPFNADGVDNVDCADTAFSSACEAIPLFNTGAQQILSVPGRYCLAEDLTAAPGDFSVISIRSSDVYLDLNGHVIRTTSAGMDGVSIFGSLLAPLSNIHIYNGAIDGELVGLYGVETGNFESDLFIEDVTITRFFDESAIRSAADRLTIRRADINNNPGGGIFYGDSTSPIGLKIVDTVITNNNTHGIGIFGAQDMLISGCTISHNDFDGINIDSPTLSCVIVDCEVNSNGNDGIHVILGSGLVTAVTISRCTANYNTFNGFNMEQAAILTDCIAEFNTRAGFSVSGVGGAELNNCTASNNTLDGFNIVVPVVLRGCIAQANGGDGFELTAGAVTSIVQNCIAKTNTGVGFRNALGAANQFYANTACNNTVANYSNVVTAAVMLPDLASAWQNVACVTP